MRLQHGAFTAEISKMKIVHFIYWRDEAGKFFCMFDGTGIKQEEGELLDL